MPDPGEIKAERRERGPLSNAVARTARVLHAGHRRAVALVLAASLALQSCGTLLHPERQGQPHSGRLDPAIVMLDAAGLLLFLVPGVIAFVVDFSTGAIYLPPDACYPPAPGYAPAAAPGYSAAPARAPASQRLVRVPVERDRLSREGIEQAVARETGQPVSLQPGRYRAEQLESLDRFEDEAQRLSQEEPEPGTVRDVSFEDE